MTEFDSYDGMSTDTIGSLDSFNNGRTSSNGGRTGGWKLNPKIASKMQLCFSGSSAALSSEMLEIVGIAQLVHCCCSRL